VIFVSAEDEVEELHRRLDRMTPRLETLGRLTIAPLAGKDAVLAAPMGRDGLLHPTPLFAALKHIIEKHRPDLLILDTLADLFGGDEIKKVHARQFIALLRGLALDFNTTVLLLSHPSQAGLSSGSGMSGNTAWNNSVRSRLYLERRINRLDGSEDDRDIRVLTTKKSNRAASGGQIVVRYSNGIFVREKGCDLDVRDLNQHSERVFLSLLAQFERDGRTVSDRTSSAYAPAVFSKHPNSEGIAKGAFQKAMDRLFASGRIKIEEVGPPSRRTRKIAIANAPEGESRIVPAGDEADSDSEGGFDDAL
jgi:RecA-family ATPase